MPKEDTKIVLTPKTIALVLAVLVGSGGVTSGGIAVFDFATNKALEDSIKKETERHVKIDETFKEQKECITELKQDVMGIKTTQMRQISRNEARRLTEDIKDREKRENDYDRLFIRNLQRLEKGQDPCSNLDCSN